MGGRSIERRRYAAQDSTAPSGVATAVRQRHVGNIAGSTSGIYDHEQTADIAQQIPRCSGMPVGVDASRVCSRRHPPHGAVRPETANLLGSRPHRLRIPLARERLTDLDITEATKRWPFLAPLGDAATSPWRSDIVELPLRWGEEW